MRRRLRRYKAWGCYVPYHRSNSVSVSPRDALQTHSWSSNITSCTLPFSVRTIPVPPPPYHMQNHHYPIGTSCYDFFPTRVDHTFLFFGSWILDDEHDFSCNMRWRFTFHLHFIIYMTFTLIASGTWGFLLRFISVLLLTDMHPPCAFHIYFILDFYTCSPCYLHEAFRYIRYSRYSDVP